MTKEERIKAAEIAALNEKTIMAAVAWLLHDARSRTDNAMFGKQIIEVNWDRGRVAIVHIRQEHSIKPGDQPPEQRKNSDEDA